MNILFICGSMHPGHDGVGDYTRRLAIELIRQGQNVSVVAVNDKHISDICYDEQSEGLTHLTVLRLPSLLKESKRFQYVKDLVQNTNPDLLSLQFVPFSFHPKGLSLTIKKLLKMAGKGISWHIMFHELWVGMEQDSNFKHFVWGKLQKQLIRSLIVCLRPVVMHTQTGIYKLQLEKIGFQAKHLPLFSNIPVINRHSAPQTNNFSLDNKGKETISFVIFGGIQPGAPVDAFAAEAAAYANKKGIRFLLKIVGRSGIEQQRWEIAWKAMGMEVEIFGEQPVEVISEILGNSSFGISTTPLSLVEKSSTNAAMRAHGLQIICVKENWRARGIPIIPALPGIIEYKVGNFKECLDIVAENISGLTVSEISKKFINDLSVLNKL